MLPGSLRPRLCMGRTRSTCRSQLHRALGHRPDTGLPTHDSTLPAHWSTPIKPMQHLRVCFSTCAWHTCSNPCLLVLRRCWSARPPLLVCGWGGGACLGTDWHPHAWSVPNECNVTSHALVIHVCKYAHSLICVCMMLTSVTSCTVQQFSMYCVITSKRLGASHVLQVNIKCLLILPFSQFLLLQSHSHREVWQHAL